ncbi:tRNA (N6-threonylcarbamoyladenosine(37)-N6)-methyltransferase TrmO [Belnapia sp. F-4-1]|uniref:tRNA (N6-threonylcarbamoyladenosine(37)-N6)-methyltransferase TrmO n=1 Tax=Belnapia sp. F-4-1 TaxID=1545443 RepID=UPI00068FACD2|nr:tRNA (N6-threonylcarbamoyladenosine(37)-N6)-methyltransferase TrmO [Belnapia sp. F-4-1]
MPGFTLTPIGHLETPWPSPADCPRNGRLPNPRPLCRAVVGEEFRAGLDQLDSFSHLILLYWMHLARPAPLAITPRFAAGPRGVFATRAPVRPNPIALSVVQFEGFDGPGVLLIRNLDCASGTPLLDIKPYLPTVDAEPAASMGWLAPRTPS